MSFHSFFVAAFHFLSVAMGGDGFHALDLGTGSHGQSVGRRHHNLRAKGVDMQVLFRDECVDDGGDADDVTLTSLQDCKGSTGR